MTSRYQPIDTFNTGTIVAGATATFARPLGSNYVNIMKIKVIPSGATTGYEVNIFKKSTCLNVDRVFATKTNVTGNFITPTDRSGSEILEGWVVPYETLDADGNLNITVTNHDTVSRNYDVSITWEIDNTVGVMGMNNGGTGAVLVPANGGIVYSDASALAILAPTATASKMLLSGSNTAPSWSTSTIPSSAGSAGKILVSDGTNYILSTAIYPVTTVANRILYSSADNTISSIASNNNGVLLTSGAGVPTIGSVSSNLVIASSILDTVQGIQTSSSPSFAGLTLSGSLNLLRIGMGTGTPANEANSRVVLGYGALPLSNTGSWITAIGSYALAKSTDGDENTGIGFRAVSEFVSVGSVAGNTGVGAYALQYATGIRNTAVGSASGIGVAGFTGSYNAFYGAHAGSVITSGNNNTLIGTYSGNRLTSHSGNIRLGMYAGSWNDADSELFIDNVDRLSAAAERTGAIIYGVMNATPSSQTLTFNAVTAHTYAASFAGLITATAGASVVNGGVAGTSGLIFGSLAVSPALGGAWASVVTPSANNYALGAGTAQTALNAPSGGQINFQINATGIVYLDTTGFHTQTDNAVANGDATHRWSAIYGLILDSGNSTALYKTNGTTFLTVTTGQAATFAGAFTASTTSTLTGQVGIGVIAGSRSDPMVNILKSGTDNTNYDTPGYLTVTGPYVSGGAAQHGTDTIAVQSNTAMNGTIGASIGFYARIATASTTAAWYAGIVGGKDNSTSGDTAGFLELNIRKVDGSVVSGLRFSVAQSAGVFGMSRNWASDNTFNDGSATTRAATTYTVNLDSGNSSALYKTNGTTFMTATTGQNVTFAGTVQTNSDLNVLGDLTFRGALRSGGFTTGGLNIRQSNTGESGFDIGIENSTGSNYSSGVAYASYILNNDDKPIQIGIGGAVRWVFQTNATYSRAFTPFVDNSYDIGTSTLRVANLYAVIHDSGNSSMLLKTNGTTWATITTGQAVTLAGALKVVGNVGFFNTAVVAQQVSGANLTNNVTAGGTDDTIADFSNLTVYATDAAAIRNDIYQLSRKLKQVNDALRTYGLLT